MGAHSYMLALLYAYPLSLYAVRLLFPLILPRTQQLCEPGRRRSLTFSCIWYLQLLLSLLLLTTTILAAFPYVKSIQTGENIKSSEAFLLSHAAVALYFFAGLLPDPDGPFEPSLSHLGAWILGSAFEVVLTVLSPTRLKLPEIVLGSGRIATLIAMVVAHMTVHWQTYHDSDVEAHENLLGNGVSEHTDYGAVSNKPPMNKAVVPRPKGGWLDYFIGFRILFPYIWPSNSSRQQLIFLVSLLLMLGQRMINFLVPWQLEILVESLGRGKMPYKNIALYVLCRGLQGQQGILGSLRAILWIPVSQALFRRLTCSAFEHILGLSLDFHLSKRLGEVMSALNKGSALNTFLDGFAFQLFPMVFDLGVAAVYFLIRVDAFYSLIVIGVMWSYVYMTIYMAKWRARARREMATKDREMDAAKMDTLMSYETVHHNDAVPVEVDRFGNHVTAYQKSEFLVLFSLNFLNITQNMVLTLGVLLVTLISALEISVGMHSVAMFVGILGYFTQLQAPLQFFGSFYNQVQTNLVEAERMLDLFKEKPTIVDDKNAKALDQCTGCIEFKNVSFAYEARKPALKGVSFKVEPGTKTAIVGESGSGKSTCLKLLYRFYDVNEGSVEIDHEDVRNLKHRSFRKHIGVVPQDTILFNMTIMYNLKYARPDATDEDVYEACRAASIHHKILSFPDGYDTPVGERGLRLSGGEKQRIAIARAILKDPQIILLDEATASLDSQTEKQIQGALETVTRGRTTLTIAHRLSTITGSDQIIVLHEGEIVERGTHEQLLRLGERYSEMWERQTNNSNGAEDDVVSGA